MQLSLRAVALISLHATGVCSNFLGARFPAPVHFSGDGNLIAAAWKNATAVFDSYFKGDTTVPISLAGLENLTFSGGVFSVHDPSAQSLQYHYTSDEVKNGPGAKKVDANTIYRVASITKLITTFTLHLELSDKQWDQPITDFIPGLASSELAGNARDRIRFLQWEQVTIRALASHMAGIPPLAIPWGIDYLLNTTTFEKYPDPVALGFPAVATDDPAADWKCSVLEAPNCTALNFFQSLKGLPPTFETWTTSAYANIPFILLGIALSNVTGKPIAEVYPSSVFGPLGMTNSKSAPPPESEWSQCAIPKPAGPEFGAPGGLSISSGGLLSTVNDLAKLGIAILNNTHLPAWKTRKWMKPASHTNSLTFSSGEVWEIYRFVHPTTGAISDIYTKSGDSGSYTGYSVLIPDYDAGFNLLTTSSMASAKKTQIASTVADIIITNLLPALEAQAQAEAVANFAGTYTSTQANLHSTLKLAYNSTAREPGLYIEEWTYNGTDVPKDWLGLTPAIQLKLQPSIRQPGQVGFHALFVRPALPAGAVVGPVWEMFSSNDFVGIGGPNYGGVSILDFVFDIGADGKAVAASPVATRETLKRVA